MLSLFIIMCLCSPWLIWTSFLFYNILLHDNSFAFIISSRKQLWKYQGVIFGALGLSFYIFFIRLQRVGQVINIWEIWDIFASLWNSLSWFFILFSILFIIFFMVFWLLLLKCFFKYINKCIFSLYIYYCQYWWFMNINFKIVDIEVDYMFFFLRRITIFTTNLKTISFLKLFWPTGWDFIEKNLFRFIIPYVCVFDYLTKNGILSTIFLILPWYYVYTLIKLFRKKFEKLYNAENQAVTEQFYGFAKNFDGSLGVPKIH